MNRVGTITWVVATMIVALVAASGGYWFALHRSAPAPVATSSAVKEIDGVVQDDSGKRVLYWHDPMVPGQRFQKPGRSPFMDMPLAPMYAEDGDANTVSVSPRMGQSLGVRTATVTSGTLDRRIEAVGSVVYNERAIVLVQPRAAGFVERVTAKVPLDPVKRGDPLVELLIPEWAGAQEEYLAIRRLGGADNELLRQAARQRLLLLGMTDAQIDVVDTTGRPAARLTITAPVSGVVAELGVREGMSVAAGMTLYKLVDLSSVWVNAEIPELQAGGLRPGARVEASVPAWPGEVFRGQVGAILPDVDLATRTLKARIELANPGARLKPGMFARIAIASGPARPVPLAPIEAVIRTGERSVVIVQEAPGKFRPVEVATGNEADGRVEITKGLRTGDVVVVSGQFLIDSEASLKSAGARMLEPSAASYEGIGKIERIAPDAITLTHEPIPALKWGEMTMEFKPPTAGWPSNVRVGDAIRFEFRAGKSAGDYELTRVTPLDAKVKR